MCGIIGIVGHNDVAAQLYDGLMVLQHRGQDAAGIAVADGRHLLVHKGSGLVSDVFDDTSMRRLIGHVGIGHCRYPTAGSEGDDEAQPFYVNSPYGIALAHNGNLINADDLRREVFQQDRRNVNTESDSEVLLNVFAHELGNREAPSPESAFKAVTGVYRRCVGGYAVVAAVLGLGLVAFRDPNGIRPLVLGKRTGANGDEYAVASESVAFDLTGFKRVRDVLPGEAVVITVDGELHARQCVAPGVHTPCIFEYVYFARPDSMIDDVSVHKARMRMGQKLGEKILRLRPDHDIDTVIPIPDSSRDAALEVANVLGIKYREGFIKNRYVGRTFIMPGQEQRAKSVRRKLNPIPLEFRNRVVLLVDDSIVRGTTSRQIVQMAREAGARKVYLASAAPPVRHPNIYGIDMPTCEELIAHQRSEEEIETLLGCDWLIYQDLTDLEDAVSGPKHRLENFDSSCFNGDYVTGTEADYFERIKRLRSDEAKTTRRASSDSAAPNDLFQAARACLDAATAQDKVAATVAAGEAFRCGTLLIPSTSPPPTPIGMPGRPLRPALVHPRQLPKRGFGTDAGRAAFIHAIAHIEFNAIDLAWDAVYRFRGLPPAFYADWVGVAVDEARHFTLLRNRLRELGYDYGDFDAHNGLWEMAVKTAHDGLTRMALVPRVLEARGLDVTPGMIDKLRGLGDYATVAILEVILREEVAHVAAGSRWFRWYCARAGVEPGPKFRQLLGEYARDVLYGPFNLQARSQAGFDEEELAMLLDAVESRATASGR